MAFLLFGCQTTPLDVLEISGAGGNGQTCAKAPAPLAGSYRIRSVSSGKCLGIGTNITVGNLPARLTAMVNDCSNQGEIFQLIPDGGFGSFQLRATSIDDNVDIEMLGTDDGTRAIYFAPNGLKNQRFTFSQRRDAVFALVPAHAPLSCLADVLPQPEIYTCRSDQTNQDWELLPASCD